MDFDLTAGVITIVLFCLLYTLTKGDCGPCGDNVEGMSSEPSPQFGVSPGSAQTHASSQSTAPSSNPAPAQHVGSYSSGWSNNWSNSWRPWSNWGGFWNSLPSYYDYDYDYFGVSPRDYHGLSLYSALAYNTPGYGYRRRYGRGYGYPYRYDDLEAENYELVYDELGRQRIIRKAIVVG